MTMHITFFLFCSLFLPKEALILRMRLSMIFVQGAILPGHAAMELWL
jgi:hypothetical protein